MPAVRFEVSDGVATLTLDRPQRRNPLDADTKRELAAALVDVRRSRAIRALVLTGSGGSFCAGGDLRAMHGLDLTPAERHARMVELQHDVVAPLITLDRPVIAAVDGAAYGGGFSLALAADFVLASERARFSMSFLRVGLVPDCGAWYTLPRHVGLQRAKELMLSGREVGAEEALRIGIAMEVLPVERLLPRAQALARSFVEAGASTVAAVKRGLDLAPRMDLDALLQHEADAQSHAFGTEAHRSALDRFIHKQPTAFRWPDREA